MPLYVEKIEPAAVVLNFPDIITYPGHITCPFHLLTPDAHFLYFLAAQKERVDCRAIHFGAKPMFAFPPPQPPIIPRVQTGGEKERERHPFSPRKKDEEYRKYSAFQKKKHQFYKYFLDMEKDTTVPNATRIKEVFLRVFSSHPVVYHRRPICSNCPCGISS